MARNRKQGRGTAAPRAQATGGATPAPEMTPVERLYARLAAEAAGRGAPAPTLLVVPSGGLMFVNENAQILMNVVTTQVGGIEIGFFDHDGEDAVTISSFLDNEGVTVRAPGGGGEARLTVAGGGGLVMARDAGGVPTFGAPFSGQKAWEARGTAADAPA